MQRYEPVWAMQVFNAGHVLQHIAVPTMRQFTNGHGRSHD